MPGYAWKEEEEALVVYFACLGLQHRVIAELLMQRGLHRTGVAVTNKIEEIRKKNHTGPLRKLTRYEADWLVVGLSAGHNMASLFVPTPEDQQIVNKVHQRVDLWEEYLALVGRTAWPAELAKQT
ncbi:uncharacterized protein ATNIH1004_011531 [Aspergillus tanneri]|uniref:Uncharacterized protein n=1 Tax=Aspergillus tanneri TaxID=1220188 RepID=A0A5M9MA88_9EURO|nr:uncharacterized protein ATNIH1004_011531 [Aspergillus tanneri]KAA8642586.1 hypothetical protein ATNIH1004_011531 [Aspergillus tanneri]